MIKFLGQCVLNFITAVKYMLDGRVRFCAVLSSATSIGYDSIPIALAIVFKYRIIIKSRSRPRRKYKIICSHKAESFFRWNGTYRPDNDESQNSENEP